MSLHSSFAEGPKVPVLLTLPEQNGKDKDCEDEAKISEDETVNVLASSRRTKAKRVRKSDYMEAALESFSSLQKLEEVRKIS